MALTQLTGINSVIYYSPTIFAMLDVSEFRALFFCALWACVLRVL